MNDSPEYLDYQRLKEALREAELRQRIIADFTYDWEYWISPRRTFLYVSSSCKRITGYDAKEFLDDPDLLRRIIHPEDHVLYDGHRKEAEKGLQSDEIEFRIIRKDGSICWIGHVCQPVFSDTGEFLGTRASNRELTRRKEVEKALRVSEEKYRTVAEFAYDWEDWLSPSGKYLYVSPSCERITGHRKDEFTNPEIVIQIAHPDDRAALADHFQKVLSGDTSPGHIDFRIIAANGDIKWISHYCRPVYGKDGGYLGNRSSNRDISIRKRREEELAALKLALESSNAKLWDMNRMLKAEMEAGERIQNALELSEERYRRMVAAITSYTYMVQIRGCKAIYTEHSPSCLSVTGYSPGEYHSDPDLWYHMIYPDDRRMVEDVIKGILGGMPCPPIEHRLVRRDGEVIWIRNTMVPYYGENNELVRYDGLIEDITERKAAEEEIQKLNRELEQKITELVEANRDLEAFNRSVSHDLKTPLVTVGGFLNRFLKKSGHKLDEREREMIEVIRSGTCRMERLIQDLLDFSRLGRLQPNCEMIDMNTLASSVLEELSPLRERRIVICEIDSLLPAWGDKALIRQVLLNIFSNALKYSASRERAVIKADSKAQEKENVYYVSDNGIGFQQENAAMLFSPFYRLPEAKGIEGTGIGLSIVERIIKRQGGKVWAEGKVDEGATFYFSLPHKNQVAEQAPIASPAA